jgi:acetyl esterase/lipase
MMRRSLFRLLAAGCLVLAGCGVSQPAGQKADPFWLSPSISQEARERLQALTGPVRFFPAPAKKSPETAEDWRAMRAAVETRTLAFIQPLVDELAPRVEEETFGNVPVLRVESRHGASKSGILIYVHGGGFTFLSARSSMDGAALMAAKTGRVVYSIDYTPAPDADWNEITRQVQSVYTALLEEGIPAGKISVFGDSAGGGIAAGSILRIRDAGLPLPAALLTQSACADLTASGETFRTMQSWDPAAVLQDVDVRLRAAQYASGDDQEHPYASPVFGDFSKGFPPTLIQAGTREFLLSDSVRLYQAIAGQGGLAVLDVYEGMPHVFQPLLHGVPESERAYRVADAFFDRAMGEE